MNTIFVVGTPRSGTTLLQAELLRLEGYTSIPETHYFHALFSRRGVFGWRSQLLAADRLNRAFGIRALPRVTALAASRQFQEVSRQYALRTGHTGLIEKTPIHLWYCSEIAAALPGARFVHIVRDRYEVVRSMYFATKRYPDAWGGARSIAQCDSRWQSDIGHHHRRLGSSHSIFVSYQQLCASPDSLLRGICREFGASIGIPHGIDTDRIIGDDEPWKIEDRRLHAAGQHDRYEGFLPRSQFESIFPLDREIEAKYRDLLESSAGILGWTPAL